MWLVVYSPLSLQLVHGYACAAGIHCVPSHVNGLDSCGVYFSTHAHHASTPVLYVHDHHTFCSAHQRSSTGAIQGQHSVSVHQHAYVPCLCMTSTVYVSQQAQSCMDSAHRHAASCRCLNSTPPHQPQLTAATPATRQSSPAPPSAASMAQPPASAAMSSPTVSLQQSLGDVPAPLAISSCAWSTLPVYWFCMRPYLKLAPFQGTSRHTFQTTAHADSHCVAQQSLRYAVLPDSRLSFCPASQHADADWQLQSAAKVLIVTQPQSNGLQMQHRYWLASGALPFVFTFTFPDDLQAPAPTLPTEAFGGTPSHSPWHPPTPPSPSSQASCLAATTSPT